MKDNKRSLGELNVRRQICRKIIAYLYQEAQGDPRLPDALKEYNEQLKSIDAQIMAITGKPPAIVIGLRTAVLDLKTKQGER